MFVREINFPISDLRGTGSGTLSKLAKLGLYTGSDLLLYCPRDYEDRSQKRLISEFASGPVNCIVKVIAHDFFGFGRMKTLKVIVEDEQGTEASLLCFNRNFLQKSYTIGRRLHVWGKFYYKYSELESSSFDAEPLPDAQDFKADGVLPVYPSTLGLGQISLRKLTKQALERWGIVDDELPPSIIKKHGLLRKKEALRCLHNPKTTEEIVLAKKTLAYEELFYLELIIKKRATEQRANTVRRKQIKGTLASALIERLPFKLTHDQEKVISEIVDDMKSPYPMARLLQGDVGSGKTMVAFIASLYAIEAGGQAALLAPTELLARQHADNAAKLLEPLGIRIAFLSGNVADKARKPLLNALKNGDIDLAVGTHALFSSDVEFKNLSFVIVDEQQRFGVLQRLAMTNKGEKPDTLMMSATPIPRTLALTVYGDLTVSTIRTMPEGRLPIITHLAKTGNEKKVYDFVRRQMQQGYRAYFVYPLVGHSDAMELKDAEAMFAFLSSNVYPEFVGGLIHAKLNEEQKRKTMADFSSGKLNFIVATSVVEVGVDVKEATCMVIEHAERFGLSVLHQLRGRVGRSNLQSYCFLVWSEKLGEDAKRRVVKMKETTDGFEIAEEDLRIRGPGEIAGTAQAGSLRLKFADIVRDADLLKTARDDAFEFLEKDPGLCSQEGIIIRSVLEKALPFSEKSTATG